jgi:hypothetical protein
MEGTDSLPYSKLPSESPSALIQPIRLPARLLAMADRRRRIVFLAIVLIYLLSFNGQWRVERDSALYLTIGRNLAEGQGYTYHGVAHHLAFPGLPLLFAGTFKLFPSGNVLPALALMLLMGFATLALMYRLVLLHADRPTAVMLTAGLAITRVFYRYCFELLSDLPFLLGVTAFLVGYEAIFFRRRANAAARTRWFDWLLLIGGLAIAVAMRPTMWVLLAAIVLAVVWDLILGIVRGSMRWTPVLLAATVVLAAVVFIHYDWRRGNGALPQYEEYFLNIRLSHPADVIHDMLHQSIPELCKGVLAKSLFGVSLSAIPLFDPLAALLAIGLCVWLLRFRVLWGLWALATIAMLLAFKPLDRYVLPIVPLLVLAWWQLLLLINRKLPEKWADAVFLVLLIGGSVMNLGRVGEMVLEQRRQPFLARYREGRYVSLNDIGKLVHVNVNRRSWVLVEPKVARILTYVSHRNAIEPTAPDPARKAMDSPGADLYVLLGPGWDESSKEPPAAQQESILRWLDQRGFKLGPQIGPAIQHLPQDRERWRLHKVVAK